MVGHEGLLQSFPEMKSDGAGSGRAGCAVQGPGGEEVAEAEGAVSGQAGGRERHGALPLLGTLCAPAV